MTQVQGSLIEEFSPFALAKALTPSSVQFVIILKVVLLVDFHESNRRLYPTNFHLDDFLNLLIKPIKAPKWIKLACRRAGKIPLFSFDF